MAKRMHTMVGVHKNWGPVMQGPRGGIYVMRNGRKQYISKQDRSRVLNPKMFSAGEGVSVGADGSVAISSKLKNLEAPEQPKAPAPPGTRAVARRRADPETVRTAQENNKLLIEHLEKVELVPSSDAECAEFGKVSGDIANRMTADKKMAQLAAVQGFTDGHDWEIRASQRGLTREELIESRMANVKYETRTAATAHVDKSLMLRRQLEVAEAKYSVPEPTKLSPLYRGMTVSDVHLNQMLTKDDFDHGGMSTSLTASSHVARSFSRTQPNRATAYDGTPAGHSVVLRYNRVRRAMPIAVMSEVYGEHEVLLPSSAGKFRITGRSYDPHAGTFVFDVEEQ